MKKFEDIWHYYHLLTPTRTFLHMERMYVETLCDFIFLSLCTKSKSLPSDHILKNITFKLICNMLGVQYSSFPSFSGIYLQSLSTGVNADKSTSCYRMDYISNYGHEKKKFTPQLNCSKVWKSIDI